MGICWKTPFTIGLCCIEWTLHRDHTIASPPAAFCHSFAADRADTSRPASAEPVAPSTVSAESALMALQVPQQQLDYFHAELLPSINETAPGGMFSLGELSVFRGKSFNIEKAVKGLSVFHPGEFWMALLSKMQQLRSCFVSFQLQQVPGKSSLDEDQATGRHLATQSVPQTSKPSRG